ncbi:hypothetical protein [Tateyamaria pelophila]|uniref:hypothetical protein n=1 Tax=Tateyamaria pelophila TaxID=328415 RepID=UPI001CBCEBB1|nr:hypothetical protein [Tateyamaria pelophila]
MASFARPRPAMAAGAAAEAPRDTRLAWLDLPFYDRLSADARDGLQAVLAILGSKSPEWGLPTLCRTSWRCRPAPMNAKPLPPGGCF